MTSDEIAKLNIDEMSGPELDIFYLRASLKALLMGEVE